VSDALGTSILFDVFALNEAVGRLLAAAMRDGPLTPGEYAIYSAVFELEAASPTELAARLGMRLTTFMDQLRLLEGRGHARRVENPRDRRSYRVVLSTAGLEAHRAANHRFERAFQAIVSHLPDGEADAKAGLLVVRQAAEAALAGFSEGASARPKAGRAG
jgi:DNA-binding MarR family transcriptional regulator